MRLECSICGRSIVERVPRALLGRKCGACGRGTLVEPESIALREEGGDPSVRINAALDATRPGLLR